MFIVRLVLALLVTLGTVSTGPKWPRQFPDRRRFGSYRVVVPIEY